MFVCWKALKRFVLKLFFFFSPPYRWLLTFSHLAETSKQGFLVRLASCPDLAKQRIWGIPQNFNNTGEEMSPAAQRWKDGDMRKHANKDTRDREIERWKEKRGEICQQPSLSQYISVSAAGPPAALTNLLSPLQRPPWQLGILTIKINFKIYGSLFVQHGPWLIPNEKSFWPDLRDRLVFNSVGLKIKKETEERRRSEIQSVMKIFKNVLFFSPCLAFSSSRAPLTAFLYKKV